MAMHKLYVLFAIIISTTMCGFLSQKVIADDIIDDKKIIFSHIYVGAPSSDDNASLKEFISIYNNSVDDIDISDWCVVNKSGQKFACFIKKTLNENIYIYRVIPMQLLVRIILATKLCWMLSIHRQTSLRVLWLLVTIH